MKQKVNITQVLEKTESVQKQKIESSRLGWITTLDLKNNMIFVDYEENPLHKPVEAVLADPRLSLEDLGESEHMIQHLHLKFLDGNPAKPMIKDVLLSTVSLSIQRKNSRIQKEIHIKADRIVLEADTEVAIKCGKTQTTYFAEGNRILQEADSIDSSATLFQKIRGGKVDVN